MAKKKKTLPAQESIQVSTVKMEKTVVTKAYEYAISKGFTARLEGGVLLFPYSDNNEKIIKMLTDKFGVTENRLVRDMGDVNVKTLPFSYGFTGDAKNWDTKITSSSNEESFVEEPSVEEDLEV